MITFLDLLVVVSMALVAAGFLSVVLMFLVRNQKVRKVCFYITVALGLYVGYIGIRINRLAFIGQTTLAAALALVCVGALILERVKKGDEKLFLISRIAAAAALVIGLVNALLV